MATRRETAQRMERSPFEKQREPGPITTKISQEMLCGDDWDDLCAGRIFTNKVEELIFIEYKWKLKVHQSSFSAALHE